MLKISAIKQKRKEKQLPLLVPVVEKETLNLNSRQIVIHGILLGILFYLYTTWCGWSTSRHIYSNKSRFGRSEARRIFH
ncbi:hypothetical protein M8J75_016655 [Diaphorina citri]|jgi:hypothetical protein|nr:hypothetical protein M8J75_016655 [Diaphorina citri]